MQRTVANPLEPTFHIGHATDQGGLGQHNSDAYLIFPSITGGNSRKTAPTWYALVADGLGNDRGSYVASQLSVESTYQALTQPHEPKQAISLQLEAALQRANTEVRNLAQEDRTLQGMATTMLAAAIHDERLYLANAGNCYAYLIRKGEVQRITPNRLTMRADSDIVADAPFVGVLPQREGPSLHRLLGSGDEIEVEHLQVDRNEAEPQRRIRSGRVEDPRTQSSVVDHLPIQAGDIIVLCSGGMARATTKEEILSVASTFPPEEAAERLVRLARRRISTENSTVVVLRWRGNTVPLRRMRKIQHHGTTLAAAALLLMVGVWLALSLSLNVSANWAQQPPASQPTSAAFGLAAEEPSTPGEAASDIETPAMQFTTELPGVEQPNITPNQSAQSDMSAQLETAAKELVSTPSSADLSVSIREHWNTFLQRSTSEGSHAATAVAPAEEGQNETTDPAESVPEATPLPIATATPTATPTVMPTAMPTVVPVDGTYVLQPNDTLWDLATAHGLTVEELLVANPHIASKDQTLTPGMAIYIPQK